ncbi:MAG: hydrolase [Candidatus Hydrogenedentes bacterium]|nr:hydrolase [Candidatus Hydrogenedentota bacterium]
MLDRHSVVLTVIDFQERLLPKIHCAGAIVRQAVRLIRFGRELGLPVLWTEQYPKGLGPTVAEVAGELAGMAPLEKTAFGCLGDAGFAAALEGTGRKQLLITGIETHVCVLQTALAAVAAGHEVFVPRDAVGSRTVSEYEAGLERMARAGAEIVTAEMAMFEVLREAGTPEFKRVLPLLK